MVIKMSEQIMEYKKCPTCGKMFFPSHANQIYHNARCCPSYRRAPKIQKICVVCGCTFLGHKGKIYCGTSCSQKAQYKRILKRKGMKKQPLFKRTNPIGVIENITISFTVHVEGNHKARHDELVWFASKHKMGNLNLDILKNRMWKVSDILLHNGYVIQDPKAFDREFAILIKKL